MGTLLQDIRFGWRRLAASPGFAAVAVLSLALGIGANTAIFTLVNAVLLRPLPVEKPEQIVSVYPVSKDDSVLAFSYPDYKDFRDRNEVFSGLIVHRFVPLNMSRAGQSERVWGYMVSGNYFDVLGVRASLGRTITPEDDAAPLAGPVAVISHGCWQRRFGADPSIVGKSVTLNGHDFQVVGVAPEGFTGTEIAYTAEVWVPVTMLGWVEPGSDWLDKRGTHNLFASGRLRPGVTREQAAASLNIVAEQLGREHPVTNEGIRMLITPPGLIHPMLRDPLVVYTGGLMAAVALVLLAACTNVANLLLARAAERRREIAIRIALGASRARLVRQLLTESLMLSAAGGAAGWLLALWVVDLVVAARPSIDFPLTLALAPDWRVFGFALLASLATGLAFGLAPALQATKPDLVPALKDSAPQGGTARSRMRSGLVVAQVAISLVVLVIAGLVVRTLRHVQTMSPGFDPANALTLSVDLSLQGYDEARGREFYRRLLERVRSTPGVRSAALTESVPLSLNYSSNYVFVEGRPPARGAEIPDAMVTSVGDEYFAAMRIPLAAGRPFTDRDTPDSPRVVVVNETFARKFFPGRDPLNDSLGRRISYSADGPWFEVVGVARDGKYFSITEAPRPFVYFSLAQDYDTPVSLVVRADGDPKALAGVLRREVQQLDEALPVYDVKTLEEHMGISLFPARAAAALLGAFGLLALVLVAVGIYGVMAYSVAQRTHEIGVRMALGARPSTVVRMVVRQGMTLAALGAALGLAGAFLLTRLLTSLFYGVSASDPLTFALVTLALAAAALLACAVPALRATKVDPMVALRHE